MASLASTFVASAVASTHADTPARSIVGVWRAPLRAVTDTHLSLSPTSAVYVSMPSVTLTSGEISRLAASAAETASA